MKKISLLILVLICTRVLSQGFPDNPTQIKEIPPSPTMWEFEKYGNYPVSMHTGVPNISIPLTSAQSGGLQVPISLSYHASGIKVDQKASWVGLGWSLRAGGAITRTIRGTQDEGMKGYINYPFHNEGTFDPAYSNNYYETEEMIQGFVDTEPDIFSYDFLGYSGKFIFKTDGNIVSIPYNDLTITPTYSGNNISSFIILTPEGIIAEFAYPEVSSEYRKAGLIGDLQVTANNVWHLKKLTAPNGLDEITFDYKLIPTSYPDYRISESESINYYDPCNSNNYTINKSATTPSVVYSGIKRIEKITYSNGYILFNSSTGNRSDDPNDVGLRLDEIKVYSSLNGTDKLIKSYEMEYDYFGILNPFHPNPDYTVRLELQKVYEVGSNGIRNNPYEFFYKDTGNEKLPPRFSYSQDYWGYYNGKANTSLVPRYQHQMINGNTIFLGDADRDPDPSYSRAGIIEKLIYPTLGYTVFEFENNSATSEDSQQVQYVAGGLRVKNISNFNANDNIQWQKSYAYTQKDNPALSSGVYNGNSFIKPRDFYYGSSYYFTVTNWGQSTGSCSCKPGNYFVCDFSTDSEGISSSPAIANNFATVFYASVKEYNGSPITFNGYKWYYYDTTKDNFVQGMGPISFSVDRSWDRGQLLLEESYENGNSNPVATVTNLYEEVQAQTAISGFKPGTRFSVSSIGYVPSNGYGGYIPPDEMVAYTFRSQQYFLTYYNEPISWKRLKSTTTVQDGITTVKNFFYNGSLKHTNVIKSSLISSSGETLETKTYYPDDILATTTMIEGGSLTTPEYTQIDRLKQDDLHQRNIPIQVVTIKDNQTLSIQRNLFKTFDGVVLPSSIKIAKGNVNVEERVLYSKYKNGKLVEVSKTEGPTTVYIWGYNAQYPITRIENTSYSVIEALPEFGTNFTVTDRLSISQENALRALPKTLVTTYTYDPLVGVASIIDSKGRATFYKYDEFNRLKIVKDQEGNVVGKNQYHFKSQ